MNTETKKQKRQCINIDKSDYNTIKKYCDDNALHLPRWIVKIAMNVINSTK